MSLYIIEDDDGNVLTNDGDFDNTMVHAALYDEPLEPAMDIERYGGHVVTLIEEPKKVVLTKEQAKIVENAHFGRYPATFIYDSYEEDEELLMNAYVNGYTVAKEKKYLVELDGLVTTDGAKQYLTNKNGKWFASRIQPSLHQAFTGEELNNAPEWAKQLNREEVTDDDD